MSYRAREEARHQLALDTDLLRGIESRLRAMDPDSRAEYITRCERVVGHPIDQDDKSHPLAILSLMAREAGAVRIPKANAR